MPNYRFLLEAFAIALLSIAKKPQKEDIIPAFFLSLAAFLQAIPAFLVFEASYGLSTSLSTLPTQPFPPTLYSACWPAVAVFARVTSAAFFPALQEVLLG